MTADADARPSAAVMESCAPNPENVDAAKSAATDAAFSRRTRGVAGRVLGDAVRLAVGERTRWRFASDVARRGAAVYWTAVS